MTSITAQFMKVWRVAWMGIATIVERIVAVAHPDNKGSWRIMEKCGMHYEKTGEHYGMDVVFYAISREEFLRPKHDNITIKLM